MGAVIYYYAAIVILSVALHLAIVNESRLFIGAFIFLMVVGLIWISYPLTVNWNNGSGFGWWFMFYIAGTVGTLAALLINAGVYRTRKNKSAFDMTLIVVMCFMIAPYPATKIVLFGCGELNRIEASPLIAGALLYRDDHQGEYPETYFDLLEEGYLERAPIQHCASAPELVGFHFQSSRTNTILKLPYISAGASPRYSFTREMWMCYPLGLGCE